MIELKVIENKSFIAHRDIFYNFQFANRKKTCDTYYWVYDIDTSIEDVIKRIKDHWHKSIIYMESLNENESIIIYFDIFDNGSEGLFIQINNNHEFKIRFVYKGECSGNYDKFTFYDNDFFIVSKIQFLDAIRNI